MGAYAAIKIDLLLTILCNITALLQTMSDCDDMYGVCLFVDTKSYDILTHRRFTIPILPERRFGIPIRVSGNFIILLFDFV